MASHSSRSTSTSTASTIVACVRDSDAVRESLSRSHDSRIGADPAFALVNLGRVLREQDESAEVVERLEPADR
jgi:hypothetical protein